MKYARLEREHRYLLASLPDDPRARRTLAIQDRYIEGTRLRLRLVLEAGAEPVRKLGQKIPLAGVDTPDIAHTTMYLSEAEYGLLSSLPAHELRKTRHLCGLGAWTLDIDSFDGPLAGLLLAEIDLAEQATGPPELPIEPVADVTADRRFSGGELARLSSSQLKDLLAGYGI